MALTFQTTIETPQGETLTNAYGRVGVTDDTNGVALKSIVEVYSSEAAFTSGKQSYNVDFTNYSTVAYSRDVDGTDILMLAHKELQTLLAAEGYVTTIELS